MQGETELIIDATRKASRFLQRDFFELSNLQSTGKSNRAFIAQSYSRALENLQLSLSKYYKKIIFDRKEAQNISEILNNFDKIALVEITDGSMNLERSIPFFAIMVTILVKKQDEYLIDKSVINFPALGEHYYAERGKGAWVQLQSSNFSGAVRARMSATKNIKNAIIAASEDELISAIKVSNYVRSSGSELYNISLLIRGNIDIVMCQLNSLTGDGIKLFVKESGGIAFDSNKNNLIISSNIELNKDLTEYFNHLV